MNDNDDLPCLSEEAGAECDYPYCTCEAVWIEENFELPSLFAEEEGEWPSDNKWPTEYEGEWVDE